MKCKAHSPMECNYPFISLLTDENLQTLNYICHTNYRKGEVKNQIIVKRKEQSPSFWKKLMEGNRGLKEENV